jgi:hypothetical protein
MNATRLTLATTLLLITLGPLLADEVVVQPQIESVGVFKNGIAVVRASFSVPGPGSYRWEQLPQAVHATFSVTSDAVLTTRSTHRLLEDHSDLNPPGMQATLEGKKVTVALINESGQGAVSISGRVLELPQPPVVITTEPTSRMLPTPALDTDSYLILETDTGRQYINRQRITAIAAEGPFPVTPPVPRKVDKPVLVFDVATGSGKVTLSYLTHGMAWIPAYAIDITDPATLSIRQSSVLRNELMDLKGTAVDLISGYPNIPFAQVSSPLDPDLTLAAFFQQLGSGASESSSGSLSQMIMSNSSSGRSAQPLPKSPEPETASADIHYQSIGKRELLRGDSLALDIAAETSRYSRIVEWLVPELRDTDGSIKNPRSSTATPDPEQQPWDALRFTNPFKFPMTTAPAAITEAGKFRGQSLSQWVNPGESTTLRITQALSIHTKASESIAPAKEAEPDPKDLARFDDTPYRRITINGELQLHNYRASDAAMSILYPFYGKFLDADAKPALKLLNETNGINPSSKLTWNVTLKAGEEQTLHYRYQIWVRN